MTNRKYNFALILSSLVLFAAPLQAQRDVLWIGGLTPNHYDAFSDCGAKFTDDYDINNLFMGNYSPEQGVDATVAALSPMVNNGSNVLGVAHDYSGVILRKLQLENPNISAMILNGVPNKGSNVIAKAIDNDGNPANLTTMESFIAVISTVQFGDNCDDCNVLGHFANLMQELENNREPLLYIVPNGPVSAIGAPTVPTAVLWGDHEQGDSEAFLTGLLSAKNNALLPLTEADPLGDCIREQRLLASSIAKSSLEIATLRATKNFFTNLLKAAGNLVSDFPNGTAPVLGGLDFSQVAGEIEAVRKTNEELAHLLRCDLANQVLASRYAIIVSGHIVQNNIEIPEPQALMACFMDCLAQGNTNQYCNTFCDPQYVTQQQIPFWEFAPNDGLYSKEEQLLDGATVTIRLAGVNHFDEPKYFHPTVRQVYQDLFNGNSGPAFVIPPQ